MGKAAERRARRAAAARARRSDPAVRAREAEASRDSARRRREDPAVRALTLLTSFIEYPHHASSDDEMSDSSDEETSASPEAQSPSACVVPQATVSGQPSPVLRRSQRQVRPPERLGYTENFQQISRRL
ncbi:hypothetical protein HPB50_023478 [Hyalomma asiaticum]|uniref:Uncharacterized protein n=1 Tax=Hyalomma asiaticum TaxID=266040 RepID=A0ACB7SBX7_HYAAI|nr:hypothetical protein HPB50_023478 [Hyalomma asiaticum]